MRTIDFGAYIVAYNFVIGVLVMLSSEKLGVYAGRLSGAHQERLTKLTRVSIFTFGTSVAVLSGTIYVLFHILRIGL